MRSFAATTPPRLFTLVLLCGVSVLSLNMFLPSLANIAAEFQADYALVSLSVAGYLGITAVVQIVVGPLSDRYGRRPLLLGALAVFVVASLGYALCMTFSTGTFYTFLAGAPLVADAVLALSPAALGFYMGTITAGFALGSFLSGRYAKSYPLTTMMILGRVVACAGLAAGLVLAAGGMVNELSLFGATVFAGLGNGLTMPSANAGALSVRPRLAGSASGLAGALTLGGGAVLTWITGAVLTAAHGALQLLGMMLFCSLAALMASVHVRRIEWSEARASQEGIS